MTREWLKRWGRGGVRRLAVLALVLAGCGKVGGGGASGPLSESERRSLPGLVAFVSERAPQRDVWLVRPSTGEETQLTRGPDDEYPAAPSPDGSAVMVVASAEMQGLHVEQLRLGPPQGGPPGDGTPPPPRAR